MQPLALCSRIEQQLEPPASTSDKIFRRIRRRGLAGIEFGVGVGSVVLAAAVRHSRSNLACDQLFRSSLAVRFMTRRKPDEIVAPSVNFPSSLEIRDDKNDKTRIDMRRRRRPIFSVRFIGNRRSRARARAVVAMVARYNVN